MQRQAMSMWCGERKRNDSVIGSDAAHKWALYIRPIFSSSVGILLQQCGSKVLTNFCNCWLILDFHALANSPHDFVCQAVREKERSSWSLANFWLRGVCFHKRACTVLYQLTPTIYTLTSYFLADCVSCQED